MFLSVLRSYSLIVGLAVSESTSSGVDPEYDSCMSVALQLNKDYYANIDSPQCAAAKQAGLASWSCAGVFLTSKNPERKVGLSKDDPGRCATWRELGVDGSPTTGDDGYKNGALIGSGDSAHIASWCPAGSWWSQDDHKIEGSDISDGHLCFSALRSDMILGSGSAAVYGEASRGGYILNGSLVRNRFLAFWPTDASTTGFPGCGVWNDALWDGPNKPAWADDVSSLWNIPTRSCFPEGDQGNTDSDPTKFDPATGMGSTILPYDAEVSVLQDPQFTERFDMAKCDTGALEEACTPDGCNSCPIAKEDFDELFVEAVKALKQQQVTNMHNEVAIQEHSGCKHEDIPVTAFFYRSDAPAEDKEAIRADMYQQKYCYKKFSGGKDVPVVYIDVTKIGCDPSAPDCGSAQNPEHGPFSCSQDSVQAETYSGLPFKTLDPDCNMPTAEVRSKNSSLRGR